MLAGMPLKDHWSELRLFTNRTLLAAVVVIGLTLLVAARLFHLQVLNYEHFRDLSRGNRVRIEPVPPTRGLIFDRYGVLLAENVPAWQLELVPEQVEDIEATLRRLTGLGLVRAEDHERILAQVAKRRRFEAIPLRYRLSEDEVARFAVQRPHYPGVDIRARLSRHYPLGTTAVHAIGYVGAINEQELRSLDGPAYAGTSHIGKVGVEHANEAELHGRVGHQQVVVNAQGRALEHIPGLAPLPGRDLYLTLDVRVQRAAERALGERRGAVVVLDPRDGSVLALASMPAFDPNLFGEGISHEQFAVLRNDRDKPLFNRALRGNYPPGSTIKPMLGLAALHYGTRTAWKPSYCPGYFSLPGNEHRYRDWKRAGHGMVNLLEAVEQSCDVYFYELAMELGIDRMHAFLGGFGLGTPTGIDIHGEKPGLMPSRDWKRGAFHKRSEQVWFPGETLITGIGQGFMLATPLQLAQAAAVMAARGERFRPALVRAVRNPVSGAMSIRPPRRLEPMVIDDAEHWELMAQSMVDVVHGRKGTARAVGTDLAYRMAGKTGTAQVFSVGQEEQYDEEEIAERLRDHALFIAYAPAEAPEVAISVLVENAGSGSSAAAPVAREVLDAYFARDSLPTAWEPEAFAAAAEPPP